MSLFSRLKYPTRPPANQPVRATETGVGSPTTMQEGFRYQPRPGGNTPSTPKPSSGDLGSFGTYSSPWSNQNSGPAFDIGSGPIKPMPNPATGRQPDINSMPGGAWGSDHLRDLLKPNTPPSLANGPVGPSVVVEEPVRRPYVVRPPVQAEMTEEVVNRVEEVTKENPAVTKPEAPPVHDPYAEAMRESAAVQSQTGKAGEEAAMRAAEANKAYAAGQREAAAVQSGTGKVGEAIRYATHPEAPIPTAPPPRAPDPLKDQGPLSEEGRMYRERVKARLEGKDPLVDNARATEDTNASRRNYMARMTAEEIAAQANGADPGTARYQRLLDENMAGARAANLAGQNSVNQLARERGEEAMGAAKGIESDVYNRATTERTYGDTQKLLDKTEVDALINSVEDPRLKYYLNRVKAAGGDVRKALVGAIDDTGTVRPEHRSESPVKNMESEAAEWITITRPDLAPGSPEFKAAVTERMKETYSAKTRPLETAEKEADLTSLREKMRVKGPDNMSPEEIDKLIASKDIEQFSTGSIAQTVGAIKHGNMVGKVIALDGRNLFTVKGHDSFGSSGSAVDYIVLEHKGKTYYMDDEGKWYDQKPTGLTPSRPKNSEIPKPF